MRNLNWAAALNRSMGAARVSPSRLAQELWANGFQVGRSTIRGWQDGSVPENGLELLPVLAKILDVPVRVLIQAPPKEAS